MQLPESFIVNNDPYHQRESAVITFKLVESFERSAVYKRAEDVVQQYSYNSLKTSDKWAVKYFVNPDRKRNQYFTSKKKAIAFAERVSA